MDQENRLPREEVEKLVFQGVLHARVEDDEQAAEIFAKQNRGKTVAADVRLKHARLRAESHRKDRQRV